MPHILLITGMFTPGGAERVLTLLANDWADRGLRVTAMALGDTGDKPFFPFSDAVEVRCLGLQGDSSNSLMGAARNLARIRVLHRALRGLRADVVISFLDRTNVLTLLASRGLGAPVIVSERTDPASRNIGRGWEIMRRITYTWASRLVCQGERPLRYFPERIRRRGVVIPNPVMLPADFPTSRPAPDLSRPHFMVAALGSLRKEKGFDLLLEAFARIANRHQHWSLIIWGQGPDHSCLQTRAKALGIEHCVFFPGVTREPLARLAEVDLFVLSSRVEGFPNALCEAMAVGLPVIATDVGAVPDIVQDGKNGVLVAPGDVSALARVMDRLMGDRNERLRLAGEAPKVLKAFSKDKVVSMWDELIREVTDKDFFCLENHG